MEDLPEIPEPTVLFRDAGLYKAYKLDPDRIAAIQDFDQPLDLYCVECDNPSVFKRLRTETGGYLVRRGESTVQQIDRYEKLLVKRIITVEFACSRDSMHKAAFVFRIADNSLSKIGQFPSLADLRHRGKRKYRKILGDQYKEYARALGLYAHGIGIGSFVYLRRIFEGLVEEAAQQKKQQDASLDIDDWRKRPMDEKIDGLDDLLPGFLVENSSIYSILSKGIHQLTEEECKEYFPVVCSGIELILEDKLAEEEKTRLRKDTGDRIARITGEIR